MNHYRPNIFKQVLAYKVTQETLNNDDFYRMIYPEFDDLENIVKLQAKAVAILAKNHPGIQLELQVSPSSKVIKFRENEYIACELVSRSLAVYDEHSFKFIFNKEPNNLNVYTPKEFHEVEAFEVNDNIFSADSVLRLIDPGWEDLNQNQKAKLKRKYLEDIKTEYAHVYDDEDGVTFTVRLGMWVIQDQKNFSVFTEGEETFRLVWSSNNRNTV